MTRAEFLYVYRVLALAYNLCPDGCEAPVPTHPPTVVAAARALWVPPSLFSFYLRMRISLRDALVKWQVDIMRTIGSTDCPRQICPHTHTHTRVRFSV